MIKENLSDLPPIEKQKSSLDSLFLNIPEIVDFNISDDLLNQIGNSIDNDRLVVFIGNHQSYFDVELWSLISQKISQKSSEFEGIYLPYSEPATNSNVGEILNKRGKAYLSNNLHLLPVIRETDRTSEKYSQFITPQMEINHKESMGKMAHARKHHFAVVSLPEGNLKGGRIDKETGLIYGIQEVKDKTFLDLIFKDDESKMSRVKNKINKINKFNLAHHTDIIPIGIDGGYKIFNPDINNFSDKTLIYLKNKEKIITIKAEEIKPATDFLNIKDVVNSIMRQKVAPLVSLEARGIYKNSIRVNLENV